jgi:hypothetical protein
VRLATHSQNTANNSGYRRKTPWLPGVTPQKGKFRARVRHNKVLYHLGYFDTEQEAHEAFKQKHRELHGEFSPYREDI